MSGDFDLNLLRVILALYEERNVTAAALRLGVSQPTVSRTLSKLRTQFDDLLFVKTSSGMKPTPRCISLGEAAQRILTNIDEDFLAATHFKPTTTQAVFTFALDEQAEICFFPRILTVLGQLAPNAKAHTISTSSDRILRGFESGEIDLAIGAYPTLERRSGFFEEALYTTDFFCLVRADRAERIRDKGYLTFRHAIVVGSEADFMTEEMLRKAGVNPRNFIRVSHYATLPWLIADCPDVLATVVCPMGVRFADTYPSLRIVAPPFKTDKVIPRQYWHNRFHDDPKNQWLRATIKGMFRTVTDAFPTKRRNQVNKNSRRPERSGKALMP